MSAGLSDVALRVDVSSASVWSFVCSCNSIAATGNTYASNKYCSAANRISRTVASTSGVVAALNAIICSSCML